MNRLTLSLQGVLVQVTVQKKGESQCSAAHILVPNGVGGCIPICSIQLICLAQSLSRGGVAVVASSLGSGLGEQLLGNCLRVRWVPLGAPGAALPRSPMHLPTPHCLMPLEIADLIGDARGCPTRLPTATAAQNLIYGQEANTLSV